MSDLITILGASYTTDARGGRTTTTSTLETIRGKAYNEIYMEVDGKQSIEMEFVFRKLPFLGVIKTAGYGLKDVCFRVNDNEIFYPRETKVVGNRLIFKCLKDA